MHYLTVISPGQKATKFVPDEDVNGRSSRRLLNRNQPNGLGKGINTEKNMAVLPGLPLGNLPT